MSKLQLIIGNKNYSSWSMCPWLFMKAAGIDFVEQGVKLFTDEWRREIAALSPSQLVPVLKDGALVVCDSLAICEYLNERFPSAGGWPDASDARALARSVSAQMHSGFDDLRSQLPMNCRARVSAFQLSDADQRDIDRIAAIWRDCRQRFGDDGPWLFGKLRIADAMYAPVVMRFVTYDVTLVGVAQDCADAVCGHRAVSEWVRASKAETEVVARTDAVTNAGSE